MILRELFESKSKSVGIIFGRFNPPHMGHMKAWEMASENSTWYVGTNKSTQGPKDPLPFDIKVKAMEAVYPEIKGHIVAEQSWLTLASKVYEKHGNIVLNVYTDEDWVTKALVQYNGKEGAHGYYEFGTIQQQATPRLSSATSLRNAVAADDRDLFGQAAGVDPNTLVAGHPFFDVVKHYLMPHAEKAAAKPVKKKVKQPEQDVAEANPKQQISRYNPDGATYRGATNKMPTLDPQDPVHNADRFDSKYDEPYDHNDDYDRSELKRVIAKHMSSLSDRQQEIIKARFWDNMSLAEVGAELGISAQRVRQIEAAALRTLKHPSRVDSLAAFVEHGVTENYWDRLQREKALESAGVGIITKQNSTVDVNKNTPKKNLKAFRLI